MQTRDRGLQPIRWIGHRQVEADGALAPVRIRQGALGNHRTLLVSPNHRVALRDARVEMLFGEDEVLVAAKHLVDGDKVQSLPSHAVTYVHLLFDQHEVIYSDGLPTESFLPGPQAVDIFEQETLDEIYALFPESCHETGDGYGRAARVILKAHEAAVLTAA